MQPELIKEVQNALDQTDGVLQEAAFVVMSIDAYREMTGVATDAEFAASVADLRRSMDEARSGKTRPLTAVRDDLGRKHEVSG